MKMTKIEKSILAIMAVLVIGIAVSVVSISRAIDNAGGTSAVIVGAGKEIKSNVDEINKK